MKTKNTTKRLFLAALLVATTISYAQVGVGTSTPDASSALDVSSTTGGFLMPRVTTTQRDDISSPATGLQVYNTTTNQLNVYNGTAWVALTSKFVNGDTATDAVFTGGNVGIGITNPNQTLEVDGTFSASGNVTLGDTFYPVDLPGSDITKFTSILEGPEFTTMTFRTKGNNSDEGFTFLNSNDTQVMYLRALSSGTNYLHLSGEYRGTTNNNLTFRTLGNNNSEGFLFLDRNGNTEARLVTESGSGVVNGLAIGDILPAAKLDVDGYIKVGSSGTASPTDGTIRYNSTTNKFQGYANGVWVDFH